MNKNGLVEMISQDGESIFVHVHASNVAAHQKLGWKLADPEDAIKVAEAGLAAPSEEQASSGKLVEMLKDGERIKVHSSNVEAHQKLGWVVVDKNYINGAVETAKAQLPNAEKGSVIKPRGKGKAAAKETPKE